MVCQSDLKESIKDHGTLSHMLSADCCDGEMGSDRTARREMSGRSTTWS